MPRSLTMFTLLGGATEPKQTTPRTPEQLLMVKILHYFNHPKLWELWYIPYYG